MNKKLLLATMLAAGMAMAQTGYSGQQSTDQQQPATSPSTNSSNSQSPVATTQSDQTSMSGCLKRSGDNFVLAADNGQSVNLTGDSSLLKPHEGHAIHVLGTLAADGSLQVSTVNMLSETCAEKQSSVGGAVSGAAGATAGAVTGAAGAVASGTEKAAGATKDAAVSGSEHAYGATKDAASSVVGGSKDAANATQNAAGNAASSAQSTAQNAVTPSQTAPAPDQSTTTPSSTVPGAQSTTAPSSTAPSTVASAEQHHKLPQSASPLPLLALLGLGSLVSGLMARRK